MATDDRDYLGRAVQALTDGRSTYVRRARPGDGGDPRGRSGQRSDRAAVERRRAHELVPLLLRVAAAPCARLRRAQGDPRHPREQEPLTLTEISQRLHRTPGSTKDYLSWLEDVDLVTARQKKYSFTDPVLRLWVRLHCRPTPPSQEEVAREVQRYAVDRMPQPEPAPALAYAGVDVSPEERKSWGIIEID
jgi:hypothetical protein